MPRSAHPLPLAAAVLLLASGCERPPLTPDPGPPVELRTVSHTHQPCMGGWCSHTIVVGTADPATGAPMSVELSVVGVGRHPSSVRSLLPEGEAALDWDFPHENGTFTLFVCVARDDSNCITYRLTRSPAP